MRRFNLHTAEFRYDDQDPDGYRSAVADVSEPLGAKEHATYVYELPPGQALCAYHYEYVEEWLIVLEGPVRLRVPEGEREVERGALVCFEAGPAGAHKLTNRGPQPARVLMFSSAREPAVAVYPDSDKIGVWAGSPEDEIMVRRSEAHVDYYEGEK